MFRSSGRTVSACMARLCRECDRSKTLQMIYHLSLRTMGILCGLCLVIISLPGLVKPDLAGLAQRFPRSRFAGFLLLTVDLVWSLWLVATIEMGEFASFRGPLLIALPIGYFLVLRFVDEFLAVRALGVLCLLAAEPLLDAAFLRHEASRLLVTVFAYVLIIAGLFWTAIPYILRDEINWGARTPARWRLLHGIIFCYGAAILAFAFVQY